MVVVHAGEQVVLDVVVDAAVDPASDLAPTARRGRDLLVEEVLHLGILLSQRVGAQVNAFEGVDDNGPKPLVESIGEKGHETLQKCFNAKSFHIQDNACTELH